MIHGALTQSPGSSVSELGWEKEGLSWTPVEIEAGGGGLGPCSSIFYFSLSLGGGFAFSIRAQLLGAVGKVDPFKLYPLSLVSRSDFSLRSGR